MTFLQFSSTEDGTVEIIVDGSSECYLSIENAEITKDDLLYAINEAKDKKAQYKEVQKQKLALEIQELEETTAKLKQKLANL